MLLSPRLAPNRAMSTHPGAIPGTFPPPCALPLFAYGVQAGFPSPPRPGDLIWAEVDGQPLLRELGILGC